MYIPLGGNQHGSGDSSTFSILAGSLLLRSCFRTNTAWARIDTLRKFPEKRFVNGGTAFGQHMMQNFRYPLEAMQAATVGKNYKRMPKMVDELIRRNPYSDKLYLQRASIERQLGRTDEACSDYKKIIYFLGRRSSPKKLRQNCPKFPNHSANESVPTTKRSPVLAEIFTAVEIPPSVPGGHAELDNYIRQNLRYPEGTLNKKVQGDVSVSFIVTEEGPPSGYVVSFNGL